MALRFGSFGRARGPSQVLHELVGEALHVDHLLLVRRDDAQHVLDLTEGLSSRLQFLLNF